MLIYVLNILNDSIKSKMGNFINRGKSIMNDASYITSFSLTNKNLSICEINTNLINIFEIIKKYKVSSINALELFEITFGNEYNDWILARFYKKESNEFDEKLILPHIVNDILKEDDNIVLKNLDCMSDNVKKIVIKTLFIPIDKSKTEINKYRYGQVS